MNAFFGIGSKPAPEDRAQQLLTSFGDVALQPMTSEPKSFIDSGYLNWAQSQRDETGVIPPEAFSSYDTFTRRLVVDEAEDQRRKASDLHVTLLIASVLSFDDSTTLAFEQEGTEGGPYLRIDFEPDRIDVALVSNFGQLERKERWYQAVLSLFEWYAMPMGVLDTFVFAKSWPADFSRIDIAAQISALLVYVFDVSRAGAFGVRDSGRLLADLDYWMPTLTIRQFHRDDTHAGQSIRLMRDVGMVPEPTLRTVEEERRFGRVTVARALEVAEANDDEVGMESLTELLRMLTVRDEYLSDMRELVDLYVTSKTNLQIGKSLPVSDAVPDSGTDAEYDDWDDKDEDEE
jgi:hypothetical protein